MGPRRTTRERGEEKRQNNTNNKDRKDKKERKTDSKRTSQTKPKRADNNTREREREIERERERERQIADPGCEYRWNEEQRASASTVKRLSPCQLLQL